MRTKIYRLKVVAILVDLSDALGIIHAKNECHLNVLKNNVDASVKESIDMLVEHSLFRPFKVNPFRTKERKDRIYSVAVGLKRRLSTLNHERLSLLYEKIHDALFNYSLSLIYDYTDHDDIHHIETLKQILWTVCDKWQLNDNISYKNYLCLNLEKAQR